MKIKNSFIALVVSISTFWNHSVLAVISHESLWDEDGAGKFSKVVSAQMVQGEQIVVNVFDPKTQKIERTPISLSQLAELQDSRLQKAITLSLENQSSWQNPESL